MTAILVCTDPTLIFLPLPDHQIQSSQVVEADEGEKKKKKEKPSLFLKLSRFSLFETLKYEQVFL